METEETVSTAEAAVEVLEQKSALEMFEQGMMLGTKKAVKHLSRTERNALVNKASAERNALQQRRARKKAAETARKKNRR
jgi:hypothetical protein